MVVEAAKARAWDESVAAQAAYDDAKAEQARAVKSAVKRSGARGGGRHARAAD